MQRRPENSTKHGGLHLHAQNHSRRRLIETFGGLAATAATAGFGIVGTASAQQPSGNVVRRVSSLPSRAVITKDRLDALVAKFYPAFNHNNILPPFSSERLGARYDIALYPLTTFTRVPETGQRVKVTGLLALPVVPKGRLPVVSWQHGTILSFDQVPSNMLKLASAGYEISDGSDSLETLFNLQRLAANGFAVIAADYLGKGLLREGRGEAYAVKAATVQCCLDILTAGLSRLAELGHGQSALFLNGWSQGGLNTQWLKQELERRRVPVAAAAAQSPFNNLAESLRYWINPRTATAGDASYPALPEWISLCLIIVLGSYREYYGLKDLFKTAIKPQYVPLAEAYWRNYTLTPAEVMQLPSTAAELLNEGFGNRYTADSNSAFLRHLATSSATPWNYNSPMRFYYGLQDEALHPSLMSLALASGGRFADGIAVPGASHRGTFLASLYGDGNVVAGRSNLLTWFQSHLKG